MADQKDSRRRSMVGAPPSARRQAAEKNKKGKVVVEEEETNDAESSSEEEADEETNNSQSKAPSSPKKRKKRRLRLTDYGTKAKKRAERRDREREKVEKKEVSEAPESPKKEKEPVEEEVVHKPKFDEYKAFQLLCDFLLRKFIDKDPEEFFYHPVLPSEAPDYFLVIQTPMDFSTMRKKVDSNEYSNIEELRKDVTLIAENAITYNKPNTIYYLAAQKLLLVIKYYFGEAYLEYLRYSLPFGNEIPLEQIGLKPKVPPTTSTSSFKKDSKFEKLREAISYKSDTKNILKQNNVANRTKLSEQKPNWHLGYIDKKKEGPISLNILTGDEKSSVTLGDLVGRLEKGTPSLPRNYELFEKIDAPISYTSYGPFSSFAPMFDSTWSALPKRESDALLACYGDKQNAVDAFTLRRMAADSSASLAKMVDGLLDTLTDGEHSRTLKQIEGQSDINEEESTSEDKEISEQFVRKLVDNVSSLENLGMDMSYLKDVKIKLGLEEKEPDVDSMLDNTGQMISDLNHLQQNRLKADPALNLNDVSQPSQNEVSLAGKVVQNLSSGIGQYSVAPTNVASTQAIHQAIGINDDKECDYDILNEFMVM